MVFGSPVIWIGGSTPWNSALKQTNYLARWSARLWRNSEYQNPPYSLFNYGPLCPWILQSRLVPTVNQSEAPHGTDTAKSHEVLVWRYSYQQRFASLNLLPVTYWHEYLDLIFFYKCVHVLISDDILPQPITSSRTTRSNTSDYLSFRPRKSKTVTYQPCLQGLEFLARPFKIQNYQSTPI